MTLTQSKVAFYIETTHVICSTNQTILFYMKYDTELKCVKQFLLNLYFFLVSLFVIFIILQHLVLMKFLKLDIQGKVHEQKHLALPSSTLNNNPSWFCRMTKLRSSSLLMRETPFSLTGICFLVTKVQCRCNVTVYYMGVTCLYLFWQKARSQKFDRTLNTSLQTLLLTIEYRELRKQLHKQNTVLTRKKSKSSD